MTAATPSTNQQNQSGEAPIYNCITSGRCIRPRISPLKHLARIMPRPSHLTLVKPQPLANSHDEGTRRTLDIITRLRNGWQPDVITLAGARHAQRWTVNFQPNATTYQFIGWPQQEIAKTSLIIASVIALDPAERWALLSGDRWVTLGTRAPETKPFDPDDVAVRAEAWLRKSIDS